MATTLPRLALYELVWSKPRTALAKQLGISDVAIGKYCSSNNVPAPPPGYWAKLNAGKPVRRTPLPLRRPGQLDTIQIGRPEYRHWSSSSSPAEPLVMPVFVEDVEEQVSAAAKEIGRVPATRDLTSPDPALARLLASEARLKEEGKTWSYKKPLFESSMHQRQLRIFNSLARAFGMVYGRQEVRAEEEWIKGLGHFHELRLHLRLGGVWMGLRFLEPGDNRRLKGWKAVKTTTLQVTGNYSCIDAQEWCDSDAGKLEAQLTDIVAALLRRAEHTLRVAAQERYDTLVRFREEDLANERARVLAEEAARLAAVRAAEAKFRGGVIGIARRRTTAAEIRATVAALYTHPDASGPAGVRLSKWAAKALAIADAIDPMNAPLDSLLQGFDLTTD